MAKTEPTSFSRRAPKQGTEGRAHNRWGQPGLDDASLREHYGKMPLPPRAGETESPKRLSGSNRNPGR